MAHTSIISRSLCKADNKQNLMSLACQPVSQSAIKRTHQSQDCRNFDQINGDGFERTEVRKQK